MLVLWPVNRSSVHESLSTPPSRKPFFGLCTYHFPFLFRRIYENKLEHTSRWGKTTKGYSALYLDFKPVWLGNKKTCEICNLRCLISATWSATSNNFKIYVVSHNLRKLSMWYPSVIPQPSLVWLRTDRIGRSGNLIILDASICHSKSLVTCGICMKIKMKPISYIF